MKKYITRYNPNYDPLVDEIPGHGMDYAPSYWVSTAGQEPENDSPIEGDVDVDVAIIGAGFTGLATAMFLAEEYGIQATVLEANRPGWGCTGRNGGQGHLAWGRLSRSQWIKRWGEETAKKIHANTLEGFSVFQSLVEDDRIDCEPFGNGNILVAHSASAMKKLARESRVLNDVFQYQSRIIGRDVLHDQYIGDEEAFGALVEPIGIAVHPLKLAFSYMRIARARGATVHPASPVTDWKTVGEHHLLTTPKGMVKAHAVVIATAGYTHHSLHPLLSYKNMPIMANCAVTRPLTDEEISACRFRTHLFFTDSRKLRYYYRFLPDHRLQIGTRSAITGADAQNPKHRLVVERAIANKFPVLKGVELEYFWSGWMDISHDMMPRIIQPDKRQRLYYAQGYSGNGVSFSAYAAKKLARLVAGKPIKEGDLPIFTTPLPSHVLRPFRRIGQRLMFYYFNRLDKLP